MKKFLSALIVIPFFLAAVMPHFETAFIGEKGDIYGLFSYSYGQNNHFWNRHGKSLKAFDTLTNREGEAYLEYAIRSKDSIWVKGSYVSAQEKYSGKTQKFRDSEAAWKHIWWCGSGQVVTSELRAILPMGFKKLPVRYGEWGGQLSLLYSGHLNYGWFDTLIGYRYYNGKPSDQIRALGSLGYNLWKCLYVIGTAELEYGIQNKNSEFDRHLIAFNPYYRLLRIKGEIVFSPFHHFALSVGGFKNVWGRMVGQEGGFYVGSWLYY